MISLYPLTFQPIYKDKIWGGQKIRTHLGKDFGSLPNCGETWEISGVGGNLSVVASGVLHGRDLRSLIGEYKGALVGGKVYQKFGNDFPLLIKFIDANEDLSIQVHPDDQLAKERHNSFGKTEMWYIFQADPGASLISGFKEEVDKAIYLEHLAHKTLDKILNKEEVKADDVFFLPAGRVHTIGKGLLLAEIQQTSDVTYRIYDFDRKDAQGNLRELHTELALDAIDFRVYDNYKTAYTPKINEPTTLVECPYFITNRLHLTKAIQRDFSEIDSFVAYICMEGEGEIKVQTQVYSFRRGDVYLMPAQITDWEILPYGEAKFLETWVG